MTEKVNEKPKLFAADLALLCNFLLAVALTLLQIIVFVADSLGELTLVYVTVMTPSLVAAFAAYRGNNFFLLPLAEIGPVGTLIFGWLNLVYPVCILVWAALNLVLFAVLTTLYVRSGASKRAACRARRKSMRTRYLKSSLVCVAAALAFVLLANLLCVFVPAYRTTPVQGDSRYDKVCAEAGKIDKVGYASFIYDYDGNAGAAQDKYCYVYTPYGYTEDKSYDILYLMHGGSENAEMWMLDDRMCNKNMVDNMIADGEIEPLIIVMPSFYFFGDKDNAANRHTSRKDDGENDYVEITRLFQYELRNDLMPVVEAEYSTFAATATEEAFIASRDHRGFAGLSMGSMTTIKSVLCGCPDMFGRFAAFAGTNTTADAVLAALNSERFAGYKIDYLFMAAGTLDRCYAETKKVYKGLLGSDRFTEGENICFTPIPYQTHYDYQWPIDLYNALHVLFK